MIGFLIGERLAEVMARDGKPVEAVGYVLQRLNVTPDREMQMVNLAYRYDCAGTAAVIESLGRCEP